MVTPFAEVVRVLRGAEPKALSAAEIFERGFFASKVQMQGALQDMAPILAREDSEPMRYRIRPGADAESWVANRKPRARAVGPEPEPDVLEAKPPAHAALEAARKLHADVLHELIGCVQTCGDPVLRRLAEREIAARRLLELLGDV